jgi:uncharacterized membrane protein (DUF2068 family)
VDWSLLACGRSRHVTYAPDEPGLRDQLRADTASGEAWCCLRCATFVPGPPQHSGPAADAPAVRRGHEIRSAFILRVFAVERFARAILSGAGAYVVWLLDSSHRSIEHTFARDLPIVRTAFRELGLNIDHSKLVGLIRHALTLSPDTIALIAAGLAGYAAIEVVEGTGLWLGRRWGEYFAMVATSLGLPFEVYELTGQVTVTRVILFAVNLALVLYLVFAKRLFGVRGGKRAYAAKLRSESVLEAAEKAAEKAAAQPAVSARQAVPEPDLAPGAESGRTRPQPAPADPGYRAAERS